MLSTHLSQFLKNIFELLERRKVDLEKSDEHIMYNFVSFLLNVFNDSVTAVDGMQLSEAFKASIADELLAIRGGILKFISHLSPKMKMAKSQQELEIYNLNHKPFSEKSVTWDMATDCSMLLGDYYWNSGEFIYFDVIQESEAPHACFEEKILKNEDLEKIKDIVNNTGHKKTQTMKKHAGKMMNSVINAETSKKGFNKGVTEKSSPNNSTGALSVPDACSDNLTSMNYGISKDQTSNYTVNYVSVRNVNTVEDLNVKNLSQSTRYISILHFNDFATINASFAIDKMRFNSILKEGTQYKCLLCSVYTAATVEGLNDHLQSLLHMDKLTKDIIWISSLGICVNTDVANVYQCCICSNTGDVRSMTEHLKSKRHKKILKSATAACGSILEEIGNATENRETSTEVLMSNFERILRQHKIQLSGKQLSCDNCGVIGISTSLDNLYKHITSQQHWRSYFLHLKKRFRNFPKIRSSVDQTYNGFINVYNGKDKCFCQICKIFIDGVSTNIMNSHIKSFAHNKCLMLFLTNEKNITFLDLNEGSQLEDEEFSLLSASLGKLEANKGKLKTNKSQKPMSTIVLDTGSYIMLDFNFAIDKYSWNGIKMYHNIYICTLCGVNGPQSDRSTHITRESHITKLGSCPLNLENLTRKMENNILLFCLVCGDWIQEEIIRDHSLAEHHKTRMQQLILECEKWKIDMNRNLAKFVFPTFSEVNHKILADILRENQLIVLNRNYSYKVFCKLCSQHLIVHNISVLYEHVTSSGHFSAFVESKDMNWAKIEPKYVNGVMTSKEDKISYCLICNLTLPSESVKAHQTSGVHEYLLPLFIEKVFSYHCLKHTDNSVMCKLCEKKLSVKSLNILNLCEHIKGSVHVKKYERVLKRTFYEMSGGIDEMSLDLLKSGIQKFQQYDFCYCSTCNILVKGASDASIFEHRDSKIHYVFENIYPKK